MCFVIFTFPWVAIGEIPKMGALKIRELTIIYHMFRPSDLDDDISMAGVDVFQSFLNNTMKKTGTR